ncbi:MAG: DUF4417 domain-containing protein [Clostridiales bacterium]|nr:DUF4417 domain-containing protein [Clostridiales bacterium]
MKKTILDDGSFPYLTEGADFVGEAGIPMLLDLDNIQVPKGMLPFEKAKQSNFSKRQYVHFYMHDKYFADVLTATNKYVDLLKQYDGIITPDCSMLIGQSKCIQQTNTYFNRAIGFYLQRQGIPVIANIRWSDESSFEYCFLGVPKHTIVCVSTHGCIRSQREKELFRKGLVEMIRVLEPTDVLVHGYMPKAVFEDLDTQTRFHRYPSLFEQTHVRKGEINGNGI